MWSATETYFADIYSADLGEISLKKHLCNRFCSNQATSGNDDTVGEGGGTECNFSLSPRHVKLIFIGNWRQQLPWFLAT